MSLDTATKHRLLLEYNNKRKEKYETYMVEKCGSKDNFAKTLEKPLKQTMQFSEDTTHLYKRLADDNENKDV